MGQQREKLSYSFLHSTACGYQNFLRYEGKIKGPTTAPLALGNAIHHALELGHKADELALDTFLQLFLDEHKRIIAEEDVFIGYPEIRKNENTGTEMITRYWDHMKKGKFSTKPLAVEQEFELDIAGNILIGKIDKVEPDLTPVDYKSGFKEPEAWQLRRNLQFTAYWFAIKQLYGEFPKRAIWHHLRNGKLIETVREPWDIEQLERNIKETQMMLEQDMRRRIYHEKVCGWCPYQGDICDDQELEQQILNLRASGKKELPVIEIVSQETGY